MSRPSGPRSGARNERHAISGPGHYSESPSMLHLLNHPLGAHIVTHLRDRTTKPATFRTLAYQISSLLAFEVTRDLATRVTTVETPLEPHSGRVLSDPIVL